VVLHLPHVLVRQRGHAHSIGRMVEVEHRTPLGPASCLRQ
jgi:hypothetical protein